MDQRHKTRVDQALLANNAVHKIYQQQISENYAPAFQRVPSANPRGNAQNKVSYNVRAPAHVTYEKPINKERSIRRHEQRERGKKIEMECLAMQCGTCECFFCARCVVGI